MYAYLAICRFQIFWKHDFGKSQAPESNLKVSCLFLFMNIKDIDNELIW